MVVAWQLAWLFGDRWQPQAVATRNRRYAFLLRSEGNSVVIVRSCSCARFYVASGATTRDSCFDIPVETVSPPNFHRAPRDREAV